MVYGAVTWIFVCAIVLSLVVGFGVGANDVANAFAPSVGAKALTMKQALLVASIFEFTGAVLMGSGVVSTIRSGIANINYFVDKPDILAYGMLCAMLATALWLLIATYWELPVSSTHSIVGAVVGMTVVSAGWDAVIWSASRDTFPYLKGLSGICLSWVISPVLAGGFAIIMFFFIRALVLRARNAYQRSLWLLPLFTFVTFFIVTYFVIAKGGTQFGWQNTPDSKKAWISAIVASGTCLISIVIGLPYLKKRVAADMEAQERDAMSAATGEGSPAPSKGGKSVSEEASDEETGSCTQQQEQKPSAGSPTPGRLQTFRNSRVWKAVTHGLEYDIHQSVADDKEVQEIHQQAEVFDRKAETSFKYLQVCTACANSFAHGSNEVANAVGPLAAIYQIWQDTAVKSSASVPTWLLAVGGVGIVIGVATWGYKVMRALGVRVTKMTNSRGFTVELCAAAVVILASRFDLPLSTTHATVGAVAGVGLLEGRRGFNWRLLCKFFVGWVATIIVVACTSAAFTAQGIYAPSRTCSDQQVQVGYYLNTTANQIAAALNATGLATGNATWVEQAQNITALTAQQQQPIVSLIPPMETQELALTYLQSGLGSCSIL